MTVAAKALPKSGAAPATLKTPTDPFLSTKECL